MDINQIKQKYYYNLLNVLFNGKDIDISQVNKLYRFKRNDLTLLPRVKEILGMIHCFQYDIDSIVDFGSQRGALLFPLIDNFPGIKITGVDLANDIETFLKPLEYSSTNENGYNFKFIKADITQQIKDIPDKSADIVIASEILEHLEEPIKAIKEAKRIAKQYIIITVPSKPDDNPEHIQYFKVEDMLKLLEINDLNSVNVHLNSNYNLFLVKIDN
jgi:SAM-dependent methyltransferase